MGRAMPFLEHLTDLRRRLIIVLASFVISLVTCFLFVDHIYHFLASRSEEKLAILGPNDILSIYIKLSAVGAIAITIPIIAYQAWRFVVLKTDRAGAQSSHAVYTGALFPVFDRARLCLLRIVSLDVSICARIVQRQFRSRHHGE